MALVKNRDSLDWNSYVCLHYRKEKFNQHFSFLPSLIQRKKERKNITGSGKKKKRWMRSIQNNFHNNNRNLATLIAIRFIIHFEMDQNFGFNRWEKLIRNFSFITTKIWIIFSFPREFRVGYSLKANLLLHGLFLCQYIYDHIIFVIFKNMLGWKCLKKRESNF